MESLFIQFQIIDPGFVSRVTYTVVLINYTFLNIYIFLNTNNLKMQKSNNKKVYAEKYVEVYDCN